MIRSQGGRYVLHLKPDVWNGLAMSIVITGTDLNVKCEPWIDFWSPNPIATNEWMSLEITNKQVETGKSSLTIVLWGECVFQEEYLGSIDLCDLSQGTERYDKLENISSTKTQSSADSSH